MLVAPGALAGPVSAQTPIQSLPPDADAAVKSGTVDFLTNGRFVLDAARFIGVGGDDRFSWDANVGGSVDVMAGSAWRVNVLVDLESVIGREFRAIDPNQANFTLEASAAARVRGTDLRVALHHTSRHLVDRPKRFPIDWNLVVVEAARVVERGGLRVDARVGVGKVIERSFVDYAWETTLDVLLRHRLDARWSVIGSGSLRVLAIDSSASSRSAQSGGGLEAGLQVTGRGAALQLFLAYAQRIDADPIARDTRAFGFAGFRFLSRSR